MNESDARCELLILGLGNVLCGDDGAGAFAVRALEKQYLTPPGVSIIDGGTLGLALLPLLLDAKRVMIADAVRDSNAAAGAIVRFEGDDVGPAARERLSCHQIGVADLLDGASLLGQLPGTLILIGIVAEDLSLRVGLSSDVRAGMTALIDRIVVESKALGFEFCEKAHRDVVTCEEWQTAPSLDPFHGDQPRYSGKPDGEIVSLTAKRREGT